MPYRHTLERTGVAAAPGKFERSRAEAARDLEHRIAKLIPLAQTSGFGFLAYLLQMAQLEARSLPGGEREGKSPRYSDGSGA
jgi:hypothetical protein